MAEFCMRDMINRAGLGKKVTVASAATSTEELGDPVYPPAKRKLREHGIDCSGKTARRMTRGDYTEYDLLIGMDSANLKNMKRIAGDDRDGKMHLLLEYTGHARDVADPWYTGDFDKAWDDIETGCGALLQYLRKTVNNAF